MKKLKLNQSGRSMVEMLGVLAIIGVLSIGGIAGFTSAMKSYKANEIVDAASMLYMFGQGQSATGGTANVVYAEHFGADPDGASSFTYVANNQTITMSIADKNVCQQVVNKLGD